MGFHLEAVGWERVVPSFGRPQELINKELRTADLTLVVFWNKIGAPSDVTIVGIDHAFSFPLAYFERHRLSSDWKEFLVDFQHHWPTEEPGNSIDLIRDGGVGNGLSRMGESSWLRLTEQWTPNAKSVFGFGVQGEVATSTHAGLPWLLYLRKQCKRQLHFWPFDGWEVLLALQSSQRFTRRCGRDGSPARIGTEMSKRPMKQRHGRIEPTSAPSVKRRFARADWLDARPIALPAASVACSVLPRVCRSQRLRLYWLQVVQDF
jgi:hypothetical protein